MRRSILPSLLLAVSLSLGARAEIVPLLNTHSHNDYEQKRPLDEALDQGFCSVEADIYLVDGQLLVAHNRGDVRPEKTLQAMYLDPLRERIRARGGVYPGNPYFILLIDTKSEAAATYAALEKVLQNYRSILSKFTATEFQTNLITVVISGNRDIPGMAKEKERLAAADGRMADLPGNPPVSLIPEVSEDWARHFHWRGVGPMPEADRAKLRDLVAQVHSQHRQLRFWDTPDLPQVWKELIEARVDLIGADHLKQLHDFLLQPPK
jgi:hypothetical protein